MQTTTGDALRSTAGVEWQTLLLALVCWMAFGLLTYFWRELGWLVLVPAGSYILCLIGSLQHEAVHGHPTRSAVVNEALVWLPVGLVFPFRRYKTLHLIHHNNDHLTDPQRDPESYYMEPEAWTGLPRPMQWLFTVNNTLLGRLLIGPGLTTVAFLAGEMRQILRGNRDIAMIWAAHLAGIALVWLWVSMICGMPFWQYVLAIAYGGLSLTLLRSFAEHRAHEHTGCRTIIVESNPVISLMFLNNNLHMAHHEKPALAWYRLPAYYRQHKERLIRDNCGYLINGYGWLFRKFAIKPKEAVAHPLPGSLKH
jgi:fatty acid desaturase